MAQVDDQAEPERHWLVEQIEQLPAAYLEGPTADTVLADLDRVRYVTPDQAVAWGRYLPDRQVAEYLIAAREEMVPGIFHRLTGALTGQGLEILSAEIHSLAHQLCLDRFHVIDGDYQGEPPPERFQSVSAALTRVLQEPSIEHPTFRHIWRPSTSHASVELHKLPTQVRVDNSTSDRYTIIDVFTADRPGLLYVIARQLFDLGLSVVMARISTHLDQVVDVFYVTDNTGQKLPDGPHLQQIRETLLESIARFQDRAEGS